MQIRNFLMVGLGGFAGSTLRYGVSEFILKLSHGSQVPLATLSVNVAGCLAIGFLGGWTQTFESFDPGMRLFLFVGILGGFTTFSTFGHETMTLLRDGQATAAVANVVLHVIVGLAAVGVGHMFSGLMAPPIPAVTSD